MAKAQEIINLDANFWNNRYLEGSHRWDLGAVSPPLKSLADSLTDKNIKILIPGGGNSHEAEYLFSKGFKNVYVVDLAEEPLKNIKNRIPAYPDQQLIHGNFFDVNLTFDLVIEQTFFCAIAPSLREKYVLKMHEILKPGGFVKGVMFDAVLNTEHPPFGGNVQEYTALFSDLFYVHKMESCYNSHETRKGRELFVAFEKK